MAKAVEEDVTKAVKNRQLAVFFLATVLLILRVLVFFATKETLPVGKRIRITQTVLSEPIRYDTAQYLKIKGLKTYLPLYPEIHYGDKVVVEGIVQEDKLTTPKLVDLVISKNFLFTTRQKIIEFYKSALPEPHASLVAGVTLGSKSGIPEGFWENLKSSGTAHVVVASGMNVTLVAAFVISFLVTFVSRKKAVYIACIFIWLYVFVSGLDAPLVRAGIMGTLGFAAIGLGRLNEAKNALFIAAYAMLLINPAWVTDLGFILSFVATLSLILFGTKIDRYLYFVPGFLREGLSTSLAAQVGVAPILYATFGQFNLLSPVINGLVLWLIGPLTVIGMLAGLIGLVLPFLGKLILYLVYPLSWWFMWVVNLFG